MQVEAMEDRLCPSLTLLVTDGFNALGTNKILRFDGTDGHFITTFVAPNTFLNNPDLGMVQGPDGNIYKENFGANSVLRFDPLTGAPLPAPGQIGANFVAPGSGGLNQTEGIDFGPVDGNLYVASTGTNNVIKYDGTTGAFLSVFVASGSGGLASSNDLHFGPDGNLYVDNFDATGKLLRFDASTGNPLPASGRTGANFINPGAGGLATPNGFAFGPDGNLYVSNANASATAPRIVRYDGTTGDFMDVFVAADPSIGFIDGIGWGPDGNLYVANTVGAAGNILRFDSTGAPLGVFGDTGTSGLTSAAGLLIFDDGTAPHGRGNHGQSNFQLASASLIQAQGGILSPVVHFIMPEPVSLTVPGQHPVIETNAIQTISTPLQQGIGLSHLGAMNHSPRTGGVPPGEWNPMNIDFLFDQE
jgi:sugar lactone lactonase YvrE